MARFRFTDKVLRDLVPPADGYRLDFDAPGGPREPYVRGFALRTTAAGTRTFLLSYVAANGRERRHKIGDYGPHTVTTARESARKLRMVVDGGADPYADAKQSRTIADAGRERAAATLGGMMDAYVEQLRRAQKPSADKVAGEIHRTMREPFPTLWKAPADSVTLDDLVRMLNKLTRAGKWRQAEKTRSYIRATYTAASASRGNAATADLYAPFAHVANIGRDLGTITRPAAASDAGKRALSAVELAAYWRHIKAAPGPHGALLRFHLLTGAQRCEQLARLTVGDRDADADTVRLLDGKGRRTRERVHLVPLIPDAAAALDVMTGTGGAYVFTLDGGAHGAVYHTVREQVGKVAAAMVEAGELGATFTPGELRITVETRLAAAGVPRETRAQLQSHGLGGVQGRHYDKHDYLAEKRDALEKLRRMLDPAGKVVPLRRARA
jgi:hypothetical protein